MSQTPTEATAHPPPALATKYVPARRRCRYARSGGAGQRCDGSPRRLSLGNQTPRREASPRMSSSGRFSARRSTTTSRATSATSGRSALTTSRSRSSASCSSPAWRQRHAHRLLAPRGSCRPAWRILVLIRSFAPGRRRNHPSWRSCLGQSAARWSDRCHRWPPRQIRLAPDPLGAAGAW